MSARRTGQGPASTERETNRRAIPALVAVAFVAGLAARGLLGAPHATSGDAPTRARHDSAGRDPGPGPTAEHDDIPAGFEHSESGARAAAASYVLTGQRLLALPPTRVGDAIGHMAAEAAAETQTAEAQERLRRLREVLAGGTGPIRYLQAVLATRVDAYTAERARVSVWSVGVLSREGVAAPQAGWTTSVFELVWERSDWKIWSETITAGPAPALNAGAAPATSAELEESLRGFTPWR